MKKQYPYFIVSLTLGVLSITLSGCSRTFFGTLLLLSFRDMVSYVVFALFFGVVAALLGKESRLNFWLCFILSLVLTPLAGLIYCLVILTKKSD